MGGIHDAPIAVHSQLILAQWEIRETGIPGVTRRDQPYGIVEYERPLMIADRSVVPRNDVEASVRCSHSIAETERGRNRFELTIDR